MTKIQWQEAATNFENIDMNFVSGYLIRNIWTTGNYYCFLINNTSVISKSLVPVVQVLDSDEILLDTLKLQSYKFNNALIWGGSSYKTYNGILIKDSPTGYMPTENEDYWQIAGTHLRKTLQQIKDDPNVTAVKKGTASEDLTLKFVWERYEKEGSYGWWDEATEQRRSPALGIYEPKDGAAGTASFGTYDEEKDAWNLPTKYAYGYFANIATNWK